MFILKARDFVEILPGGGTRATAKTAEVGFIYTRLLPVWEISVFKKKKLGRRQLLAVARVKRLEPSG
jgi:hypothetical protein